MCKMYIPYIKNVKFKALCQLSDTEECTCVNRNSNGHDDVNCNLSVVCTKQSDLPSTSDGTTDGEDNHQSPSAISPDLPDLAEDEENNRQEEQEDDDNVSTDDEQEEYIQTVNGLSTRPDPNDQNLLISSFVNENRAILPPNTLIDSWLTNKYRKTRQQPPNQQLVSHLSLRFCFKRFFKIFYSVFNDEEKEEMAARIAIRIGERVYTVFSDVGLYQQGSGSSYVAGESVRPKYYRLLEMINSKI